MRRLSLLILGLLIIAFAKAQTVDEIVQKHIEKIGGDKAWSSVKSIKMKAKLASKGGLSDIVQITAKNGLAYGMMKVDGKEFVQFAFDGEIAWGTNRKTMKPKKRDEETTARVKKSVKEFPSHFIDYRKNGFKIELMGDEDIRGTDCFKLKIIKGKIAKSSDIGYYMADDITISYIDKESYFEVATERDFKRDALEGVLYSYYKDFKEVDGLMFPFTINQSLNESNATIMVGSYELNPEIDTSIFKFRE